jgi:cytochrome b pre-mRNA-processing protein 3
VAQARNPAFYRAYGVPDTVNGRFEVVLLHTLLILRRLASADQRARAIGQGVFDTFCDDMDASLREMGVSDLGVPRQMRKVADAFYGRQQTYAQALARGDAAVADLLRKAFVGAEERLDAPRLAAYLAAAERALAGMDTPALDAAKLPFPDPDAVAAVTSV